MIAHADVDIAPMTLTASLAAYAYARVVSSPDSRMFASIRNAFRSAYFGGVCCTVVLAALFVRHIWGLGHINVMNADFRSWISMSTASEMYTHRNA